MKTRHPTQALLIAAALVATSAPVLAQGSTAKSEAQQARLEQRVARNDAQLRGKTGARERQELERQQRQIDALIGRLSAGEPVSPREIDELVGDIPLR